jgi:hypothetical protein
MDDWLKNWIGLLLGNAGIKMKRKEKRRKMDRNYRRK